MFAASSLMFRGHQDGATSLRRGPRRSGQRYIDSPWRTEEDHLVLARPLLQSKVGANWSLEVHETTSKAKYCKYGAVLSLGPSMNS